MYKLMVSDGEKKYSVCTCSDKKTIDGLVNNLNQFINEHHRLAENISLKDFLADECEAYYLGKVLDYFAPGLGMLIIMESLRRIGNKHNIILRENMWSNKKCLRKKCRISEAT